MNERTLQRRLAAEGTSFTALLREIRLERSRQYLQLRHMSLQDIAERLGYRDSVAFCHAYKEWTGQAPRGSARAPETLRQADRRAGGREA